MQNPEKFLPSVYSIPPITPPTDLQQPPGPCGWGYRDPQATYETLLWNQNQPAVLLPNYNQQHPAKFLNMSVPSAPMSEKRSPYSGTCMRPTVIRVQQRPQATSNYANWASSLQA